MKSKNNSTVFGSTYLIALVDLDIWCDRYKLEPEKSNCLHCGSEIIADQPAFSRYWRGLVAKPCECGNTTNFKVMIFNELPDLLKVF